MKILETKISEIDNEEILKLFRELQMITGVSPKSFSDLWVFSFLQQCLHPHGGVKIVKIEKNRIAALDDFNEFVLLKKIGKLGDESHRLLRELAAQRYENLDNYAGTAVYTFLNRAFMIQKKKDLRRYAI